MNFEKHKDVNGSLYIGERYLIKKWLKTYNIIDDYQITDDMSILLNDMLMHHFFMRSIEWQTLNVPDYIKFVKISL